MAQAVRPRIVILGGGFGGVYTALHLQNLREYHEYDVTLISRDNYFLMTPLLFEAGSGVLEPRHAVNPIRPLLSSVRFIEAEIEGVDFDARQVRTRHSPDDEPRLIPYDHLVVALGGVTNQSLISGSEHAMSFKTLADAIFVRNHVIDQLEHADVETDPATRGKMLTMVVVGGGLVGVELMGELTEFARAASRFYPRIHPEDFQFHLLEAGPSILPEMLPELREYAARRLRKRGVAIDTSTPVKRIEPQRLHLADGRTIEAATIVLATGVVPAPILQTLDLEKDRKGRVVVDATMRCPTRPEVWALGDCAAIPDPQGRPYPPLAQHAIREARVLAENVASALRDRPLRPFVYETLGVLASLGHFDGVGRVMRLKLRGVFAWFAWRSYYLFQMPRFERRLRIMFDWTVALFFKNDVVKLELFGREHPSGRLRVRR